MKQIRLGTIGSGPIVHSILKQAVLDPDVRLTAVYSRSQETGRALAEAFGGEKVYTDLDAFLADPQVDVVYIASPNLLHYPQAKKALLAGKHVILEKPFCPRLREAEELIALAEKQGKMLLDATPTAYLPNLEILKRELPKVGRLRLVMGNFTQYSSRYDKLLAGEVPNVFNPEFAGGALMDLNYYNAYLNAALFGEPETAVYYPNLCHIGIDTSGTLIMRYPGFLSQNIGAKDARGENFFQIEGEKGYIQAIGGSNVLRQIRVVTKDSEECFNGQPETNNYRYEVASLLDQLRREDREAIGQNLKVMCIAIRTIETARRAAGIRFPGDEE